MVDSDLRWLCPEMSGSNPPGWFVPEEMSVVAADRVTRRLVAVPQSSITTYTLTLLAGIR